MPRVSDLGVDAWPPVPIKTDRLILRESQPQDREHVIELFSSTEVGRYIGGVRSRDELESSVPDVPGQRPGFFAVEFDGALIGTVTLDRNDSQGSEGPEQANSDVGQVYLGYLFLPWAWGQGFASEACAAALDWFAGVLPGEPVLLATQTANERSMRVAARLGFVKVKTFEEWGAEQWLGRWSSV